MDIDYMTPWQTIIIYCTSAITLGSFATAVLLNIFCSFLEKRKQLEEKVWSTAIHLLKVFLVGLVVGSSLRFSFLVGNAANIVQAVLIGISIAIFFLSMGVGLIEAFSHKRSWKCYLALGTNVVSIWSIVLIMANLKTLAC